jgi:hypothetical protein
MTPDVIVPNTNLMAAILQKETHTIPIVFVFRRSGRQWLRHKSGATRWKYHGVFRPRQCDRWQVA